MAQVVVRNVEAQVISKLRRRAKRNGRSLEAEVREILRGAVKNEGTEVRGLGTRIASRFRGVGLKPDEQIKELRGLQPQVPNFEE